MIISVIVFVLLELMKFLATLCEFAFCVNAAQQQPDDDLVPSTNNNIDSAHHYALNVYGEPRKDQVHVPAYMKTGRPGAIPNQKVCHAQ